MDVVLERSGGLAGVRRTVRVGPSLGAEDEEALRDALDAVGFFALPKELTSPRPTPDRFSYRLEVVDGPRRHAVRFDEAVASEALRELIERIEDLAGG